MKRLGLISIDGALNMPLPVRVFEERSGGYGYETTVEITGPDAAAKGIEGIDRFVLSLPLSYLDFRVLSFPFSEKEKLMAVVPLELDQLVIGGVGSIVFDVFVLPGSAPDGRNFQALVVYTKKDLLSGLLKRLSDLGADPAAVTSLELEVLINEGSAGLAEKLSAGLIPDAERVKGAEAAALNAPALNLRTGPLAYTRDAARRSKKLRTAAIAAIIAGLLLNIDAGYRLFNLNNEAASIKKEMRAQYSFLFPGDKKVTDEVYQLKAHLKELKDKGESLFGVYPLQFLLDVSKKAVPGASYSEITLDKDVITLKGEAASIDDTGKLKTALAEFLADVTVSDTKQTQNGKAAFTIIAKGHKRRQ